MAPIADTRRSRRALCTRTVVCPRNPHVRRTKGVSNNPVSSRKTSVAFSERAFFLPVAKRTVSSSRWRLRLVGELAVPAFGKTIPTVAAIWAHDGHDSSHGKLAESARGRAEQSRDPCRSHSRGPP